MTRWLFIAVLALVGCRDPLKPNYEYMPDMVDSVAYDPFDPNPVTRDGRTFMAAAPGTIARGVEPFHYGKGEEEALRAGRELQNPVPATPEAVARGEQVYRSICSPCHGATGMADGPVVQKGFQPPPPLTDGRLKAMPDGQIFHVITRGGKVAMPPHAAQVTPVDRWNVIHYVRKLQGAGK